MKDSESNLKWGSRKILAKLNGQNNVNNILVIFSPSADIYRNITDKNRPLNK